MRKLVEYDSKMNELNFSKFKEKELDLFFCICYKMKNEGVNEVTLTFQELKQLSNYSNRNLDRFIKDLESTYDKMLNIKIRTETKTSITKTILFARYHIEKQDRIVKIKIYEDAKYLLNDIEKFTKFDLMEFVSLKSSYAKNMFKMLKQFDNEDSYNWYQIAMVDFREFLGIPTHYKMGNIDQRVLSPVLEQLTPYFNGLKLEKIKKGVKVESLKFTWRTRKKKVENIENVEAIKYKSSLGEKELADHEQEYKVLEREQETVVAVEKIKISKADYDNLYKKYLDKINQKPSPTSKRIFDTMNKSKYEIVEEIVIKKVVNPRPKKSIKVKCFINSNLLVSAKGNKLYGNAKQNKINKIIEKMENRKIKLNSNYRKNLIIVENEDDKTILKKIKNLLSEDELTTLIKELKNK